MDDFVEITDPAQLSPVERATMGHNAPPLAEVLEEETAALAGRRDELLASVARAPETIQDEPTSQKIADLIRLISACIKGAEAARVAAKEPHLAASRLVDATYKRITDPLDRAKRTVEARLTQYQRVKAEEERRIREAEARRQAEEAERQRQEAERLRQEAERLRREAEAVAAAATTEQEFDTAIDIEAQASSVENNAVATAEELARQAEADAIRAQQAAEAKPAELARTRGDLGALASLRTEWIGEVVDREQLDLATLRPFIPMDALERAVRAFVKSGGRELKGARIYQHSHTVVR